MANAKPKEIEPKVETKKVAAVKTRAEPKAKSAVVSTAAGFSKRRRVSIP